MSRAAIASDAEQIVERLSQRKQTEGSTAINPRSLQLRPNILRPPLDLLWQISIKKSKLNPLSTTLLLLCCLKMRRNMRVIFKGETQIGPMTAFLPVFATPLRRAHSVICAFFFNRRNHREDPLLALLSSFNLNRRLPRTPATPRDICQRIILGLRCRMFKHSLGQSTRRR